MLPHSHVEFLLLLLLRPGRYQDSGHSQFPNVRHFRVAFPVRFSTKKRDKPQTKEANVMLRHHSAEGKKLPSPPKDKYQKVEKVTQDEKGDRYPHLLRIQSSSTWVRPAGRPTNFGRKKHALAFFFCASFFRSLMMDPSLPAFHCTRGDVHSVLGEGSPPFFMLFSLTPTYLPTKRSSQPNHGKESL